MKNSWRIVTSTLVVVLSIAPFGFAQTTCTENCETYLPRLTLSQWRFEPGPSNDITDVAGVRVGHVTINRDEPENIHTGVTAVVPNASNLAETGYWASAAMLAGNGELTGAHVINEKGFLNSPIILTNTFAVGAAHTGVFQYFQKHYPDKTPFSTRWKTELPVVGECYDGFFNTIENLNAIKPADVVTAIETASSGLVKQGRVGAGTGMRSFELHAGIGSASRQVEIGGQKYTIGVLVNANHSRLKDMNAEIREKLENRLDKSLNAVEHEDDQDRVKREAQTPRQGSIMIVIATDLPLIPHQLQAMSRHAALGIGATGSTMNVTSGDGVIAFSTANSIALEENAKPTLITTVLNPDELTPVFRATVEAVTEAQINALVASHLQQIKDYSSTKK